jgi:hypothetical protein
MTGARQQKMLCAGVRGILAHRLVLRRRAALTI